MRNTFQFDNTDRLLDELENAARSSVPNGQFFDQLLSSLRLLVHAESSSVVMQVQPDRWINVAQSGISSNDSLTAFIVAYGARPQSDYLSSTSESLTWFGIPIHAGSPANGSIFLTFSKPLPPSGLASLSALCRAFAEVLEIRQLSRLERLFGKNWTEIHELTQKIAGSHSTSHAAGLIVNQLISTLSAARVSIAEGSLTNTKSARIIAISGIGSLDRRTKHVSALERIAVTAFSQSQPVLRSSSSASDPSNESSSSLSEEGTFKNLLALKFHDDGSKQSLGHSAIILEWTSRDEMLDSLPAITHFIPIVCTGWQQQQRWMRLPRFARAWTRGEATGRLISIGSRLTRLLFFATAIVLAVWFLLMPTTLTIEAEAFLEPVERRSIFANIDGFLDSLFVEDGQNVVAGQPLAKLRSPTLDLQIEEVMGQIRAIAEKRNGLRVAINQVSTSAPDALAVQTRISTDILLLETQEKQSKEKLVFLTQERTKLAIHSPIEGVVVSRELRKELEARPLRRGDSLFSIADLNGAWQLNIHVPDRDSGYLLRHYSNLPQSVSFVYDSLPGENFKAEVRHIASSVENPKGTGCYLLALASLESDVANKSHMGANARVYFSCGKQPLWFVWCRPMVEALQKRVWLFAKNKD